MFYEQLKKICDEKHIKMTPLVTECGGSKSNVTTWKNGSIPNSDIVLKLARRLNVSTDYLLGNAPEQNINNSINGNNSIIGIVGNNNAPVTIKNGHKRQLTTQEQDILRIYNASSGKQQLKIMNFVYEIEKENESANK